MVKQSFLTKEYQQSFLTLLNKRYQQLNKLEFDEKPKNTPKTENK